MRAKKKKIEKRGRSNMQNVVVISWIQTTPKSADTFYETTIGTILLDDKYIFS